MKYTFQAISRIDKQLSSLLSANSSHSLHRLQLHFHSSWPLSLSLRVSACATFVTRGHLTQRHSRDGIASEYSISRPFTVTVNRERGKIILPIQCRHNSSPHTVTERHGYLCSRVNVASFLFLFFHHCILRAPLLHPPLTPSSSPLFDSSHDSHSSPSFRRIK